MSTFRLTKDTIGFRKSLNVSNWNFGTSAGPKTEKIESICQYLQTSTVMYDGPGFSQEETQSIVKECIDSVIATNPYQQSLVNQWTSQIVEVTLANLTKLQKPYKYIVNCIIMQKTGAGLHVASSCYWDNTTDGSCTVRWENKSMYCVVSVFACAM